MGTRANPTGYHRMSDRTSGRGRPPPGRDAATGIAGGGRAFHIGGGAPHDGEAAKKSARASGAAHP